MEIVMKFRGVRGSRAVPGKDTVIYGGNTSCVELRCGGHLVILDAGTGISSLSEELWGNHSVKADILISHMHWDHIIGIPFFAPINKTGNEFRIHGTKCGEGSFEENFKLIMKDPHFPLKFDSLKGSYKIIEHLPGTEFDLCDYWEGTCSHNNESIMVKTIKNKHPNGGQSYRITYGDKSICYVTDTEILDDSSDMSKALIDFIRDTDVLIFGANYSRDEYYGRVEEEPKIGWGHSTWEDALSIATKGNVKKLYLFHHKAERTDAEQGRIETQVKKQCSFAEVAREGMVVII